MITHDEYRHDVDIDEYGGRSPGPAALSPGPLIPVFGDSFAFGLGVRDAETFVSVIDARISERLINVGMPGSSLPDELDSLDALDGALNAPPPCVFVVFLGNDLEDIEVAARATGPIAPGRRQLWINRGLSEPLTDPVLEIMSSTARVTSRVSSSDWLRQPRG